MTSTANRLGLLSIVAVLGCHRVSGTGVAPVDDHLTLYASEADTQATSLEEMKSVYHQVLRFYRPAGERVRWLDRKLLAREPGEPGEPGETTMDGALATSIVEGLGKSFCLMDQPGTCRGTAGGTLRVSRIYHMNPNWARVVVSYAGVEPYGQATVNSQVFLLEKRGRSWKIRSRATASGQQ